MYGKKNKKIHTQVSNETVLTDPFVFSWVARAWLIDAQGD
jgi:hypothetical protein